MWQVIWQQGDSLKKMRDFPLNPWGGTSFQMLILLGLGIGLGDATANPDKAEHLRAQVQALLAEESKVLTGLDQIDRQIVGLEGEQARLSAEHQGRRKKVAQVDEEIKGVRAQLDVWKNRLKRRLRARSNLQLDDAIWRRLFLGSGTQNDWLRRRGYIAAIVGADLKLIKRYRRSDDRLMGLRKQRLAAVDIVRAKAQQLEVKGQALRRQRRVKKSALLALRDRQTLLKKVLHEQMIRQRGLKVSSRGGVTGILAKRGQLKAPVAGRLARKFGPYKHVEMGTTLVSKGWIYRARIGTEVRAVFDGIVAYSGWYTGFGNLIIIDHGHDHHTIYAHLNAIHRAKGEFVSARDLIGKVGDSGSLNGPQLYFELRVNRKPVDPAPWMERR